MKRMSAAIIMLALCGAVSLAGGGRQGDRLAQIEQALKDDIPRLVCVDERLATAGQPRETAFARLSENGFKSVLNLRTDAEGIDLGREREMAVKAGLRYISVPVAPPAISEETVNAFINAVKDKSNHPMLIHCASANRVGAMMMIYRVLEQGWPEQKALEEATKIGLSSEGLKKFAQDYIASHRKGSK